MEFELPKSVEDTKDPVILETRNYNLMMTEYEVADNNAQTGQNIILTLAVTGEGPEADGISFKYYIPLPNPTDEGKTTRQNQPMVDWKVRNIADNVKILGGTMKGTKFVLPQTAMVKAMIKKEFNDDGIPYNTLDGRIMKADKKGPSKS